MTEKFVSRSKPFTAALMRTTFSAPVALSAMMSNEPKSTYFTSEGKRICTVFRKVTSIRCGAIIWLVGNIFVSTVSCAFAPSREKSMTIDKIILVFII